jgi:uncharacterized membrane protein
MRLAVRRPTLMLLAVLPLAAGCDTLLPSHPVVTIIGPSTADPLMPPVEIRGTVTGSSDIVRITYNVNGLAEEEVPITPAREVAFSFVLEELRKGTVVVTVSATDSKGNRGQSVYQFQTPLAPQITILEPAEGEIIRHPGTLVRVRVRHLGDIEQPTYAVGGTWKEPLEFETRPLTGPVDTVIVFSAYFGGSGSRTLTVRVGDGETYTDAAVNVQVDVPQREYAVTFFGEGSQALGLNDSGTVVGRVTVDGRARAFSWSDGVTTLLSTLEGAASSATSINADGIVAGVIDTGSCPVAAVWENGVARILTPEGTCYEHAVDINNNGFVLVNRANGHEPPALVNLATGDRTVFPTCGAGPGWHATSLNDQNRVVGFSQSSVYSQWCRAGFPAGFAFPWVDVTIFGRVSYASDINNHGTVVVNTGLHGDRIVITGETGEAVYVSGYGHGPKGRAINDNGTVLTGAGSAVRLWTPDRTYDLRTGTWEVDTLNSHTRNRLNNLNAFVATVTNTQTGVSGGALLTPAP